MLDILSFSKSEKNKFRPLTGGADQDKEENIDYKRIKDGYDGAFGNGDTWGL